MAKSLNARAAIHLVGGKGLHIPPEGWNAQNFRTHGGPMIVALARLAKLTQRKIAPEVARAMVAIFKRQLHDVIERVSRHRSAPAPHRKASLLLGLDAFEPIWLQAIDEVFKDANPEVTAEMTPPIQSVMAQAYSRVGILLGQESDQSVNDQIARDARLIAQRVTSVNQTTRDQIEKEVRDSISQGLSVSETATRLEQRMPGIFGNRALTIARTELNTAWSQGAARSFKQSTSLTHISVIGCEAREPGSPHYQGQSTCNYPDLPVGEMDEFLAVGFHPNHTGNMVPSRFRDEDGTVNPFEDRPSEAIDDSASGEPLPPDA
jgi:hypothetical protein